MIFSTPLHCNQNPPILNDLVLLPAELYAPLAQTFPAETSHNLHDRLCNGITSLATTSQPLPKNRLSEEIGTIVTACMATDQRHDVAIIFDPIIRHQLPPQRIGILNEFLQRIPPLELTFASGPAPRAHRTHCPGVGARRDLPAQFMSVLEIYQFVHSCICSGLPLCAQPTDPMC